MSEFGQEQTRPAGREGLQEFLDDLRAAEPGIVSDMAALSHDVIREHGQMKNLSYWLMNNGGLFGDPRDPAATDPRREESEQELKALAGRLEIHGDPAQIDAVVRRYEDMTPAGRNRRG